MHSVLWGFAAASCLSRNLKHTRSVAFRILNSDSEFWFRILILIPNSEFWFRILMLLPNSDSEFWILIPNFEFWFRFLIMIPNSEFWFWFWILNSDFEFWFWSWILILIPNSDFDSKLWLWFRILILIQNFEFWYWILILISNYDSAFWFRFLLRFAAACCVPGNLKRARSASFETMFTSLCFSKCYSSQIDPSSRRLRECRTFWVADAILFIMWIFHIVSNERPTAFDNYWNVLEEKLFQNLQTKFLEPRKPNPQRIKSCVISAVR